MQYADFTYYQSTFHGNKISTQTEYTAPSERASEYIDSVTFGRASENTDAQIADKIKRCCCALAEQIHTDGIAAGKTSEKIGSYSVSYAECSISELNRHKRSIASQYLGSTGLMSRSIE